jgi:DNA invertase Pin-like site-specific DNA recombinase
MNVVTYRRVSTKGQQESGLGLEGQAAAIAEYVARTGAKVVGEFVEAESGKRTDRPELDKALAACRRHKATLVIAKLDRLARNLHFLTGLMEAGVEFCAIDNPNANRLTIHILAAVAEDEARRISERTKVALAAAKARGTVLGNPNGAAALHRAGKGNSAAVGAAREAADRRARDLAPVFEELRAAGVATLHKLAAELNARGLPTPRGGRWHPSNVANVLQRLEGRAA